MSQYFNTLSIPSPWDIIRKIGKKLGDVADGLITPPEAGPKPIPVPVKGPRPRV